MKLVMYAVSQNFESRSDYDWIVHAPNIMFKSHASDTMIEL